MTATHITMDLNDLTPPGAPAGAGITVALLAIMAGLNRLLTIFKRDRAEGSQADADNATAKAAEVKAVADAATYQRLLELLEFEQAASASLTRTINDQNELLTKQTEQISEQSRLIREQSAQLKLQAGHIEQLTGRIGAMERHHAVQMARLRTSLAKMGLDLQDFTSSQTGAL